MRNHGIRERFCTMNRNSTTIFKKPTISVKIVVFLKIVTEKQLGGDSALHFHSTALSKILIHLKTIKNT